MKRSTDRILTSHTGSLHRTEDFEALTARHFDPMSDPEATWLERLPGEIEGVVKKQRELGIDVVNDGEYSKPNWLYYVAARMDGFGDATGESEALPDLGGATDIAAFPQFYDDAKQMDGVSMWFRHSESFFPNPEAKLALQACTGPVKYTGHDLVAADIENLKAGLSAIGADPDDGFIGVAAPGTFGTIYVDEYYGDREKFLFALADAIGEECKAITDAGLNVQIDDPNLPSIHDMLKLDRESTRELGELIVAATNRAIEGIPPEQVRYHCCWGSWNAPHGSDIELKDIVDLLYKVNAGTYSIEAANARHDHEWRVFQDSPLPDDKALMPGVVSHATNVVEHPEGVAEKLIRFAEIVGPERVVAGSDCGFRARSHPEVAWAKLKSMGEGAEIASKRLFS